MKKLIIIKKSPIVIVKNFIILQSATVAAFFLATTFAYYSKIYRSFSISHIISFHVAEALLIFSAETAIVLFIFFRWYKESFQIRHHEIVHAHGIFYRYHTTIPFEHIVSVNQRQSPPQGGFVVFVHNDLKQALIASSAPT